MKRLLILGAETAGTMMANRYSEENCPQKNGKSCAQVDKVLTVGKFYEASAGAQIIFT